MKQKKKNENILNILFPLVALCFKYLSIYLFKYLSIYLSSDIDR